MYSGWNLVNRAEPTNPNSYEFFINNWEYECTFKFDRTIIRKLRNFKESEAIAIFERARDSFKICEVCNQAPTFRQWVGFNSSGISTANMCECGDRKRKEADKKAHDSYADSRCRNWL